MRRQRFAKQEAVPERLRRSGPSGSQSVGNSQNRRQDRVRGTADKRNGREQWMVVLCKRKSLQSGAKISKRIRPNL